MENGIVRVGFLGSGGIARGVHMGILSKFPDVKLAGFCDINPDQANASATQYGGTAYTDPAKMIRKEKLDALYVCLPPFAHGKIEVAAAKKGIALFVEKPLGVTLQHAQKVRDAIAASGAVSAVGYNWRALTATAKARELIAGQPVSAAYGYWLGGMPGVMWWRQQAQSGGQMNEQTTHIVDVARYLIGGKVVRVYAQGAKGICAPRVEQHDIHDNSIALMTFDNGCVCSIGSGHITPDKGTRIELELILDGLTLLHHGGDLVVKRQGSEEVFKSEGSAYEIENRAFIDAVKNRNPGGVICSYAEAFETHRVTMAATKSLLTGKVVTL